MSLSTDLISQFVKSTKDTKEITKETTVYGNVVYVEDDPDSSTPIIYVQIDGTDGTQPTPASSIVNVNPGERVSVLIKDHTATITDNLTTNPARSDDVNDLSDTVKNNVTEIVRIDNLVAEKADIESLNAEKARIDNLTTDNANIKVRLTANEASIESLEANYGEFDSIVAKKLDVDTANAKFATIENLNSTNTKVENLEANYGEFDGIVAKKLDVDTANATYAKIEALNATKADVTNLDADIADINALIFGSASGNVIHTSFANAVIAQLGNAQIKSAMIEDISADKITSGDIITNDVQVKSEDGKLLISDETIQISDNNRVRVQIGKDAVCDYSINIWDTDGKLMFSEGGITDSAIKEAIIRNDMVSDDANISAHKLDIDSLFEEINGSSKTIKSTKVYLDDKEQTLDIAFESLTTDVTEIQNGISSQGTQISTMQGQISSKIWQQDINTAVNGVNDKTNTLSTQYTTLEQKVNGLSVTVASQTTSLSSKADSSTVTAINNKVTSLETNLSGFKSSVGETYATKTELTDVESVANDAQTAAEEAQSDIDNLRIGGRNLLRNSKGNDTTDWTYTAPVVSDSLKGDCVERTNVTLSSENYIGSTRTGIVEQATEYTFSADVWRNEYLKSFDIFWLSDTEDDPKTAAGYVNTRSSSSRNITPNKWTRINWTFTTHENDRTGFIRLDNNGTITEGTAAILRVANLKLEKGNRATDWTPASEDLESRVTQTETQILQNGESISLLANRTTVVENKFSGYSTTEQMNSAIEQKANSITSTVRETYTSKAEFENLEVGGRNLIAGTSKTQEYVGNASGSTNGYKDVWGGKTINIPTDTSYVVSFDAKADVAQNITCYFYSPNTTLTAVSSTGQNKNNAADGSCQVSITTEWKRYWVKWTQTPADSVKNIIIGRNFTENDIYIRAVKLEVGNIPTDWTLAPEDMATADALETVESITESIESRVATSESLIQQLSDSISTLVTDGNGESLMVQTANGWTFSTGNIQNIAENTSENLDILTNEMGDVNAAVDVLKQAVSDLGILNEYVKIGTYENEPCVEIGEIDSDFKLVITNTRILFMEGTGVPAYLNNQSLFVNKAVIEEELHQGDFVWKVRNNGNLGLIWKGAD